MENWPLGRTIPLGLRFFVSYTLWYSIFLLLYFRGLSFAKLCSCVVKNRISFHFRVRAKVQHSDLRHFYWKSPPGCQSNKNVTALIGMAALKCTSHRYHSQRLTGGHCAKRKLRCDVVVYLSGDGVYYKDPMISMERSYNCPNCTWPNSFDTYRFETLCLQDTLARLSLIFQNLRLSRL